MDSSWTGPPAVPQLSTESGPCGGGGGGGGGWGAAVGLVGVCSGDERGGAGVACIYPDSAPDPTAITAPDLFAVAANARLRAEKDAIVCCRCLCAVTIGAKKDWFIEGWTDGGVLNDNGQWRINVQGLVINSKPTLPVWLEPIPLGFIRDSFSTSYSHFVECGMRTSDTECRTLF